MSLVRVLDGAFDSESKGRGYGGEYPQSCAMRMTAPSAEGAKGRSPSGGFAIALWKPSLPTYRLVSHQTLAGRGGSVSRRDHNQAYRRHTPLTGGTKPEETATSNASRSSGEGVWGRGASLREAASPPESPPNSLSGREREGGAFRRKAASLASPLRPYFSKEATVWVFSKSKAPVSVLAFLM